MNGAVPQISLHGDAHDVFAAMVREVFDAAPVEPVPTRAVSVAAWHLGVAMLGAFAGPAMRFVRDPARVAASGLDQILVQLYTQGGFAGIAGDTPIAVGEGDICVFDLTDTIETRASAFANISLLIPRAALRDGVADLSVLHGLVVAGDTPMGAMLADHLRSLTVHVGALQGDETRFAAGATLSLVAATLAVAARGRAPGRTRVVMSPLRRACDYIDAHIDDPTLDVARIARATGCSRAVLFRLFAGEGGVGRYIRRRRLGGAARDLIDPLLARRVGEVARRWGFSSDAVFSRAFRQAFGVSPRVARQHRLAPILGDTPDGDGAIERRFTGWMRSLRGARETPGQ